MLSTADWEQLLISRTQSIAAKIDAQVLINLNILPTVTVREGHRVKIYLSLVGFSEIGTTFLE